MSEILFRWHHRKRLVRFRGDLATGARWGTEDALEDPSKFQQGDRRYVQPGYFEAMGTRVIAGRGFTEADDHPQVMHVIDELFAAKAFPGQNAVGKRFMASIRTDEPEWFEVIGVVEHQRHISLAGIAFGLLTALVISRVIRSMLVGVQPTDPLTFATTAAAFLGIAAVACLIPARRAATLDPNAALRDE